MRKKWIALLLSLTLIFVISAPAFADDSTTASGALTLSSTNLGLKPGETMGLYASDNGTQLDNVTLTSANPAIATVTNDGMVTGVAFGRTTVTVKAADGRTATCDVHVAYKGIDVSSHQGVIDWGTLKSTGLDFAIIRTGYGDESPETQTDTQFAANYAGAVANGLKVGVYHYSYAATRSDPVQDAVKEANMCLGIINKRHLDYPVFYDMEGSMTSLSSDKFSAAADAFCTTIAKAGYRPAIYSSANGLNKLTSAIRGKYDIWVANYDVDSTSYSGPYKLWQYTSSGGVPGIGQNLDSRVDLDYCYVTYPLPVPSVVDDSFLSDTGSTLTLKTGKTYVFKFTPKAGGRPVFSSGNAGVVQTVSVQKIGSSYYLKIRARARGCTSVYSAMPKQNAVRRCVVTVA